ncbi:MAG: hypothetical protein Tsb009_00130 [Planctomycetaceae bacterium]
MSEITAALEKVIAKIADELLGEYKSIVEATPFLEKALPDKDGLLNGLLKLVEHGSLVLPGTPFKPAYIELAKKAITAFQDSKGILLPDGFLGKKTLNLIAKLICCPEPTEPDKNALDIVNMGGRINPKEVRVHLASLPNVDGSQAVAVDLFKDAWNSWQFVCGVGFLIVQNRQVADVVVETEPFSDGVNGNLALADVGPPTTKQLTLTFDANETFVSQPASGGAVFEHVACHEIGHILGLSHQLDDGTFAPAGQLMHKDYQEHITTPQSQDIQRAVKIWGPPQ